jgi:PIN domain nuclease of toxin-antitoxin system
MKYLLDTHALIWFYESSESLPAKVKGIIDDVTNRKFISTVSLWEIIIKLNIKKLSMKWTFQDFYMDILSKDFEILQISGAYLMNYLTLPSIHRDPFDRILVSTAISDNLIILTHDKEIQKYEVKWLWE